MIIKPSNAPPAAGAQPQVPPPVPQPGMFPATGMPPVPTPTPTAMAGSPPQVKPRRPAKGMEESWSTGSSDLGLSMGNSSRGASLMGQSTGLLPTGTPAHVTSPNDVGPRQLIVNYIASPVNEVELRAVFEQYGPVQCARIIYDKATGQSKGYGFVYFFHSADAATAMKAMQNFELHGRNLRVAYAVPQRPLESIGGP